MSEWIWLPETINFMSLVVSFVVLILVLVLWFFMNRASLRANEKIVLLEQLVDLQKRQNSLLRRLCEANEPELAVEQNSEDGGDGDDSLVRMVAER